MAVVPQFSNDAEQVIGANHSTSSQPDDRFNKCKWDVNSNAPVPFRIAATLKIAF